MNEKLILKAEKIYKSYKTGDKRDVPVLKGIDIEIFSGDFKTVMGPSGAGKSTLLHLLGLIDNPDKGKISILNDNEFIDYDNVSSKRASMIRNRKIGFIFQYFQLLPEFTALENVAIPGMISGKSIKELRPDGMELLNMVGMADRAEHKPAELSGGEQQRVAIARALINKPMIVFADEPTGSLDAANSESVLELISTLRKDLKLTFLVATHNKDVAEIAENTLYIRDGKFD